MSKIGPLLIVIGAILLLLSAFADALGLGSNPDAFGPQQLSGVIAGIVLLVAGIMLRRRRNPTEP